MTRRKWILIALLTAVTLPIIYTVVWLLLIDVQVRDKFEKTGFVKPTTYYSAAPRIFRDEPFSDRELITHLQKKDYREKTWGSVLRPSDFAQTSGDECVNIHKDAIKCIAFHHHEQHKIYIIAAEETDKIVALLSVNPDTQATDSIDSIDLFPEVFAQYLGSDPILQKSMPLSRIPRWCLDAALAIEDPDFLNHQGVSFRGLARAILVNLKNFRLAQGGSTITQQLVKNYFLTAERTFSRKLKEMFIALIVEARVPKDQILETYLNIIYLGQQGSYQIRGIGAAAPFYFNKPADQLDLAECALLGAIINSPGRYSPFKNPDNSIARRKKVLTAMLEQQRILKEDYQTAIDKALPQKRTVEIKETSPYFIEGVQRELADLGFNDLSGYSIYTTMNLRAQEAAQKALQARLNALESSSDYHQKNKTHGLQGVVISSDPKTGELTALIGGRDHRKSPFNRIFDGHRQVGSVFKPIVFLAALINDLEFNPMTSLENSRWTYTYEKQKWSPHNYDNSTSEKVPAFYALKESLNIPTARLALQTGLDKIIALAKDLGVTSDLKPLPSISLGSFEMRPIEVLGVYTTIARWGLPTPLTSLRQIKNSTGDVVLEKTPTNNSVQIGQREDFVLLESMLMETMTSGTARSARASGLTVEAAGKTGTTSNYKDAWFAGITENQVSVVWVGYDDNTPLKLSGSSGALPIWTEYMKHLTQNQAPAPFRWPDDLNIKRIEISAEELINAGVPPDKAETTFLVLRKN